LFAIISGRGSASVPSSTLGIILDSILRIGVLEIIPVIVPVIIPATVPVIETPVLIPALVKTVAVEGEVALVAVNTR
jgi:hypothetical protein